MTTIIAPLLTEKFLDYVDTYLAEPQNDVTDLLIEFREFDRLTISGLYDRVYKQYPYNANAVTSKITSWRQP